MTPLVLHAVVESDLVQLPGADLRLVPFRSLAAVVAPLPPGEPEGAPTSPRALAAHRAVVEALFQQGAVLPAPAGVVARGEETVERWLELHCPALSEAMAFVDGRCAARVHVTRAPLGASSQRPLDTPPLELDQAAAEVFRSLRRHAAAAATLRPAATEEERATAAFLVEADRWQLFKGAVEEEARRDASLRLELTGPWPPYDFVKMQFGG